MELEVRYVTTSDGVRIAYAIAGSGPPLVAFTDPIASHVQLGWSLGQIEMFGPLLPMLAAERRVIGVDLHGHGRTALGERLISPVDMGDRHGRDRERDRLRRG